MKSSASRRNITFADGIGASDSHTDADGIYGFATVILDPVRRQHVEGKEPCAIALRPLQKHVENRSGLPWEIGAIRGPRPQEHEVTQDLVSFSGAGQRTTVTRLP